MGNDFTLTQNGSGMYPVKEGHKSSSPLACEIQINSTGLPPLQFALVVKGTTRGALRVFCFLERSLIRH